MTFIENLVSFVEKESTVTNGLADLAQVAIADCLGAIIKGSQTPLSRTIAATASGSGCATVAGFGKNYSMRDAAMINGVSGHVLELDDTCSSNLGHPTVAVLPALMAAGESFDSSGMEFVRAFILATEIECKIGRLCARSIHKKGWHATSVIGVFGAAIGAGIMMKLNRAQLEASLGIAASFASGIRENFGSPVKPIHVGKVNQDGVYAALLAQNGITASLTAIEGKEGFLPLYATEGFSNPHDEFTKTLGNPYDITFPGFAVKQHPSCSSSHRAIDGFFDIVKKYGISKENIQSVSIGLSTSALRELVTPHPRNGNEAKFSIGFQIALMLLGYKNMPEQYTAEFIFKPEVQDFIQRVDSYHEPAFDNLPADMGVGPADVTVVLDNGNRYEHRREWPVGHLRDPIPPDMLKEKFMNCSEEALGRSKAEELFGLVLNLRNVANLKDITKLLI